MQIRSMFMRPYASQKPDSYPVNALVVHGKRPYEQMAYHSPDGNYGTTIISRYQHDLYLDLWVIKLKFQWIGGYSAEAKELRAREARERVDSEQAARNS